MGRKGVGAKEDYGLVRPNNYFYVTFAKHTPLAFHLRFQGVIRVRVRVRVTFRVTVRVLLLLLFNRV
jgi:hypothetical protein